MTKIFLKVYYSSISEDNSSHNSSISENDIQSSMSVYSNERVINAAFENDENGILPEEMDMNFFHDVILPDIEIYFNNNGVLLETILFNIKKLENHENSFLIIQKAGSDLIQEEVEVLLRFMNEIYNEQNLNSMRPNVVQQDKDRLEEDFKFAQSIIYQILYTAIEDDLVIDLQNSKDEGHLSNAILKNFTATLKDRIENLKKNITIHPIEKNICLKNLKNYLKLLNRERLDRKINKDKFQVVSSVYKAKDIFQSKKIKRIINRRELERNQKILKRGSNHYANQKQKITLFLNQNLYMM